jgi:hypothetical protein
MANFIPNLPSTAKTVYIYAGKFSARSCQFFYTELARSRPVCFAFLPSLSYPSELSKKHTLAFPLV